MTDDTNENTATRDVVQSWLDGYLTAWRSNDPDDVRTLFADDATYAGSPFDPAPWVGLESIVTGWLEHRDEPGTWTFEGRPLVYRDRIGVVQGRTDYSDGNVYANLWVIEFDESGKARTFVEWFMEPGPAREDQVD